MARGTEKKKPKIIKRGNKALDVEIEADTTIEEEGMIADIEAELGPGNSGNKTITFHGNNLPINQTVAAALAHRCKRAGYRLRLKIPKGQKKDELTITHLNLFEHIGESDTT